MSGDWAQKETKGIWRERRFGVFVALVAFCGNPRLERCWTSGLSREGRQGWIHFVFHSFVFHSPVISAGQ
jgi:hypothetical protein